MLWIKIGINNKEILKVDAIRKSDDRTFCEYEVTYKGSEVREGNLVFNGSISYYLKHPFEAGFIQLAISMLEAVKQVFPSKYQLPYKEEKGSVKTLGELPSQLLAYTEEDFLNMEDDCDE